MKTNKEIDENKKCQDQEVNPSIVYICDKCDFETIKSDDIKSHEKNKHMTKNYKCEECEYQTKEKDHLREHKKSRHGKINTEKRTDQIKCKECDFRAESNEIMKKHMEVAMGHKKQSVCRYFMNNRCRFGRFCRFQHSYAKETPKSNKQCNLFEKCPKFPSCGNEHKEICKFQEFCKNNSCNYVHLREPFLGLWMKALKQY